MLWRILKLREIIERKYNFLIFNMGWEIDKLREDPYGRRYYIDIPECSAFFPRGVGDKNLNKRVDIELHAAGMYIGKYYCDNPNGSKLQGQPIFL